MWTAILGYTVVFVFGGILGILGLCAAQSGARSYELFKLGQMGDAIRLVLKWDDKPEDMLFPRKKLQDALKED